MKKLESDYVARYEYACSLITAFFERELSINVLNKDDLLFNSGSTAQVLFTSDYSTLVQEKVRLQITNQIRRLRNDANNFIVARCHGVLTDLYSILGVEFMDALINNTAHGITAVGKVFNKTDKDKVVLQKVTATLRENPELLIFIIGSKLYQKEFIRLKQIAAAGAVAEGMQ